ncbi:LPXTG cell wall anchor domain-containing protein [Corynebacterium diphtheriae]|uniref:prealbumin-like fold domain-containing protein n=1 Tax=Corynebacterium diphtheriae TaxID=1717 RepID=UPI0009650CCC|nr:prealbumin-like fold domain-containing protein [Corynebacterium diphtheriae]OLN17440.1 fimbrial assembly protein [Corynebacterium diphtheriae]RKW93891.1 LPXTG cell wall anchor domain-containing protein [Corynebacterium diphtheriae]
MNNYKKPVIMSTVFGKLIAFMLVVTIGVVSPALALATEDQIENETDLISGQTSESEAEQEVADEETQNPSPKDNPAQYKVETAEIDGRTVNLVKIPVENIDQNQKILTFERQGAETEFFGHGDAQLDGIKIDADKLASAPAMDNSGILISIKISDLSLRDAKELTFTYSTSPSVDKDAAWNISTSQVNAFSIYDNLPDKVTVIDPTIGNQNSVTVRPDQIQVPDKTLFDNGKCKNSWVNNVFFYAPENINANKIILKPKRAPRLYEPPVDTFNHDTSNIKVAEHERMFRKEYKPLWEDIRRNDISVTKVDEYLEVNIPQGIKMEKGEYVKLTNVFSSCYSSVLSSLDIEIQVIGETRIGGFCEDRVRYTFPARDTISSQQRRVIAVTGNGAGALTGQPYSSLKEVSEKDTGKTPYSVLYTPIPGKQEYVLRNLPYHDPSGEFVSGDNVVSRKAPRELTQTEKDNGTNVFVSESQPNAQIRWKSYIARQDAGTGKFARLGGPNQESGWIVNALAYNPNDNWLYAISQGRLGENWGRASDRHTFQGQSGQWRAVITAEDPCYPAGHLLQIDPVSGEVYNLGRVTKTASDTDYAFQGTPHRTWPNDLWGGINVGSIGQDGNFYVANASLSGTGAVYKVNLENVTAEPLSQSSQWLKKGIRYSGDWYAAGNNTVGRAWSEDWTPLYVPNPDKEGGQRQAGNYMWGITNGWNSGLNKDDVFIERINLDTGVTERWSIRDKRTKAGQSIKRPHQWGRAWAYGNGILGFATASAGANGDVLQIKVINPEASQPEFELLSVNAIAQASYNSNGTSSINEKENVVDLAIKKTRRDVEPHNGKPRVEWDVEVSNLSKDAASSGFTVFDTIPKGYKVVELKAAQDESKPNGAFVTVQISRDKAVLVGQHWSAYLGHPKNNDVIEAKFGVLKPGAKTKLIIVAEPENGRSLPKQCVENVAGVIGLDRDPNTKKLERESDGKDAFGNSDSTYGGLDYIGREFSDVTSDSYCRGRLTVIKNTRVDGKTEQRVNGWNFTAKTSKTVLLDAAIPDSDGLAESKLTTGANGHFKGQVSWIIHSSDEQTVNVKEDLEEHEGFKLESVKCYDEENPSKEIVEQGSDRASIKRTIDSNGQITDFSVTLKPNAKKQLPQISCEVTNVKDPQAGELWLKKASYNPEKGAINNDDLDGWKFIVTSDSDPAIVQELSKEKPKFDVKLGSYTIVETQSPSGYSLLAQPIKITIGIIEGNRLGITSLKDASGLADYVNPSNQQPHILLTVADVKNGTLPKTGGYGVAPWVVVGTALIILAILINTRRKNRSSHKV